MPVRRLMAPNARWQFVLVYTMPGGAKERAVEDVSGAVLRRRRAGGGGGRPAAAPLPARAARRRPRGRAGRRRRQGADRRRGRRGDGPPARLTRPAPSLGRWLSIGAHVDSADPLAHAAAVGAEAVQFFLGDPQGWKAPPPHPHADAIRASDLDASTSTPRTWSTWRPRTTGSGSRAARCSPQHAAAAAAIGAKGLIVHGGHVTAKDDPGEGVDNWRKTFERARRRAASACRS